MLAAGRRDIRSSRQRTQKSACVRARREDREDRLVFLVPKEEGDEVRGPLGASPLDSPTWKNSPPVPISGGGAWTSFTLDPDSGLLHPGRFAIDVREGENFYTDSFVVLDAKTGVYKNHFKLVPRDWHDWDASNPPALIHSWAARGSWLWRRRTATSMVLIRQQQIAVSGSRHQDR